MKFLTSFVEVLLNFCFGDFFLLCETLPLASLQVLKFSQFFFSGGWVVFEAKDKHELFNFQKA